jgi:SAM-dependent methyltransferase
MSTRPPSKTAEPTSRPPLGDRAALAYNWLPRVGSVLDLGCADGYVTAYLRNRAAKIVGVDLNFTDVRAAKGKVGGTHFVVGIAEALPFASASFDAVLMLDVLEHVGNDSHSIDEIVRVMRTDGYLILSTPHKGLFGFLDPENFFLRGKSGTPRPRHRHYSVTDYKMLFGDRLTVTRTHRGGLLVFPLVMIARKIVHRLMARGWRIPLIVRDVIERTVNVSYKINYGRLGFNVMVLARKLSANEASVGVPHSTSRALGSPQP